MIKRGFFLFLFFFTQIWASSYFYDWLDGPKATGNWFGGRSKLEEYGFNIQSSLTYDTSIEIFGGRKRAHTFQSLFDINLNFTSDPLLKYHGGLLFADYQVYHGRSPTKTLTGSVEVVDNQLDATPITTFNRFSQLFYKQLLLSDRLWFLFGKSDAMINFMSIDSGYLFMNSGFSQVGSLVFMPTYPFPAMSLIVGFTPWDWVLLKGAVFDGSLAQGYNTGNSIIGKFFQSLGSHAYLIGELDLDWRKQTDWGGIFAFGGWYNTAKIHRFNGTEKNGTGGFYGYFEQTLWIEESRKRFEAFVVWGMANQNIAQVKMSLAFGGIFYDLWYSKKDLAGFGMSTSWLSTDPDAGFTHQKEMTFEGFYRYEFLNWLMIMPDFQYIVHPGGQSLSNAFITTIRAQIIL